MGEIAHRSQKAGERRPCKLMISANQSPVFFCLVSCPKSWETKRLAQLRKIAGWRTDFNYNYLFIIACSCSFSKLFVLHFLFVGEGGE